MRSRPKGWRRWPARRTRSTPGSWPSWAAATSSPEIWLPDPAVRAERERARFRLHLVRHRTALKNRVHAILIAHGIPTPSSDLFGAGGRRLLERLALPEPWRSTTAASLALIDTLDEQIDACQRDVRRLGADHPYVRRLITCPGVAWILAFTIASEIGDIARFHTPTKLIGYTGLTPKIEQSGESDRRGPLRKNGPNHLRWALVKQPTPPAATRSTSRSSSATVPDTDGSAAASSPPSRSLAGSPKRSGTW
jgi:transposase